MAASACLASARTTSRRLGRLLLNSTSWLQLSPVVSVQSLVNKQLSASQSSMSTSINAHHTTSCTAVSLPVLVIPRRHLRWYTDKRVSGNLGALGIAKVHPDVSLVSDESEGQEIAKMVNTSLEQDTHGRMFAVVSIAGSQRKVTTEDVLVIEAEFPPTVGEKIRLEKVLMVGSQDFSLIGQPMLSRDQVRVEATVIEKTLSHNQVWSTYKRRKRFRKLKLFRTPQTMVVINKIELNTLREHLGQ